MRIQYFEPLSRGISRTKRVLFNPRDLTKWLVVGFTVFLAGLADAGFFSGMNFSNNRRNFNIEEVLYFPQKAWEWLGNHPGWVLFIGFAVFIIFVISILITWVSARGKFMFLDNVVHDRSRVAAPWHEYREEGNSFFLCNFLWGIFCFAVGITYIFFCFLSLQGLYEGGGNNHVLIVPAILAGLGLFILSAISVFIFLLLRDFIIPIMYRDRIPTIKAVQKFLPLFLSHFLHFIGYGIFQLGLRLLIIIGIVIAGCATCCIGFLILIIPYINAVVLLPIAYAMRCFSIEFLEQFGPEFQIFPKPEIPPAPDAQPITL
jgi:hypothetical protein